MDTDNNSNKKEVTQESITLGQLIKMVRIEKNISLNKIIESLHLSESIIKKIESDDYGIEKNQTFMKGHARGYAHYLGISHLDITDFFSRMQIGNSYDKLPETPSYFIKEKNHTAKDIARWFSYLAIFCLLFVAFLIWHFKSNPNKQLITLNSHQVQQPVNHLTHRSTDKPPAIHSHLALAKNPTTLNKSDLKHSEPSSQTA